MFTRFRSGRRASPPRLSVERLEDRLVPHGPTFGADPAALAVVGPVAAASRSDGPSHDQGGPHFDLPSAGKHEQTADNGPAAAYGRGNGGESRGAVPGWQGDGKPGHGSDAHGTPADEHREGGKVLTWGVFPGQAQANDPKVDKGQKNFDDDPAPEGSRPAPSAARPSPHIIPGHSEFSRADGQAETAAPPARPSTNAVRGVATAPPPAAEPAPAEAPAGGVYGPPAPAPVAVSDGGVEASARPAAAAAGAPVPVLNLLAATQEGSEGATETAPAGSPAAGNSAALAVLDSHAAGPATLHGTAGLDDDFLRVVLARDVPRVSDGALAEAADLGAPAAPAASPAAAYDGYATLEAPAGGLLDRLGLDTRALDAALQNFLHGLDGLGGRLADPRARLGASAWLLTGAAALAVVELDRRRRRAAAAEDAGEGPLTWPGPGAPAPEPAS